MEKPTLVAKGMRLPKRKTLKMSWPKRSESVTAVRDGSEIQEGGVGGGMRLPVDNAAAREDRMTQPNRDGRVATGTSVPGVTRYGLNGGGDGCPQPQDKELMEEMPPAVALSFRTANSTCDNSMEIACLKLITETAGLLPNSMDAVATSLSPEVEQSEAVAMEEGGDGDDLDVCRAVGSFQEDLVSMERKFLGGIACSAASSIGSGSRSINSTAGELLDMDLPSETCTPTSLQVEKSGEILNGPSAFEFGVNALTVSMVDSDFIIPVTPIVELATQEDQHSQASSSSKRSVFLVDYIPFWGQVSICGRRPEMEDAVVAVPYFYEIPLWLLIGNQDIDGLDSSLIRLPAHFFGVYDGHGGSQVQNYLAIIPNHLLLR
ncbi:hypothetical protein GW17_00026573 [Ensete ventricosum]|nr:hypothetical protein GW17_00026573 [Ensete ventricosum]